MFRFYRTIYRVYDLEFKVYYTGTHASVSSFQI